MIPLAMLCMSLLAINGSNIENCDWNYYVIEDHNMYLNAYRFYGGEIESGYTYMGVTLLDEKMILISKDYLYHKDKYAESTLLHEYYHAHIYEQWRINPILGYNLNQQYGLDTPHGRHLPFLFH